MSYVTESLLPGENVVYRTKLHWMVFLGPGLVVLLGLLLFTGGGELSGVATFILLAGVLAVLGVAIVYNTSEFAVTDRRVLIKVGLINRRSLEINLPKIESVEVSQDIGGRIFDYGVITVAGTGGTRERFKNIIDPKAFRLNVQQQAAQSQRTMGVIPAEGATVRQERDCPHCGETILAKAKVCKHCSREVEPLVVR